MRRGKGWDTSWDKPVRGLWSEWTRWVLSSRRVLGTSELVWSGSVPNKWRTPQPVNGTQKSKSFGFFLFAVRISLKRAKSSCSCALSCGTWATASLYTFPANTSNAHELTGQRTFPTRLWQSLTSAARRNAEGYDSINNITEGIPAFFSSSSGAISGSYKAYRLINFVNKLTTKTTIRVTLFLPFLHARWRKRKEGMFIVQIKLSSSPLFPYEWTNVK